MAKKKKPEPEISKSEISKVMSAIAKRSHPRKLKRDKKGRFCY